MTFFLFPLRAAWIRRSFSRAQQGLAAIELALIAPVVFLFIMGIIEISLVFLVEHLLENAAYNASRTAKTGYIEEGKTQLETVMDELMSRIGGLEPLLNPADIHVTYTAYGNLSAIGQPEEGSTGLGTPEQVVVYTISYPWKLFTPMVGNLIGDESGIVNISSRIVVRNEPFNED